MKVASKQGKRKVEILEERYSITDLSRDDMRGLIRALYQAQTLGPRVNKAIQKQAYEKMMLILADGLNMQVCTVTDLDMLS